MVCFKQFNIPIGLHHSTETATNITHTRTMGISHQDLDLDTLEEALWKGAEYQGRKLNHVEWIMRLNNNLWQTIWQIILIWVIKPGKGEGVRSNCWNYLYLYCLRWSKLIVMTMVSWLFLVTLSINVKHSWMNSEQFFLFCESFVINNTSKWCLKLIQN